MRAVILAGGKGTRLKPYTVTLPKPLVPIGGEMPILEIIIIQLARSGFDHITLAVNHLANLIMAFFGDGSRWNVKIDYSLEEKSLSTIGPLTLIEDLPENFLVMNGDILCDLDYLNFYNYHLEANNDVTVSTYKREAKIDFGVLTYNEQNMIVSFLEKPTYNFDVSMGVYCLNRRVIERLTKGEPYGFDNLMIDGIKNKMKIEVKPFLGYWLDIGRPEDYDNANENYAALKHKLGLI
ncbi:MULTISPECIES: sugar phosphate nucleotidyltransferase [Calothrix]|uniref:NTP transferase domain-containing protein n=2 Tax=Calothrix TaxID=1186 RepID=A0ABR8AHL5_9CYAN|nr:MULTISPECIES: sugar phosphate nucleotidyltransferase [Calothrix]MBD2199020.1 NTP transferase domain-containing protein [Calothrix parietina FACHB-288]MBD2227727.1 NTP transferase domain-containing protein [Calothrix anomala FACHB-343]